MSISNITNSNPTNSVCVRVCVWIGSSRARLPDLLTQTMFDLIAFWRIKIAMTESSLKHEPNQPNKISLIRFLGSPNPMCTLTYSNLCLIMKHHVLKLLAYIIICYLIIQCYVVNPTCYFLFVSICLYLYIFHLFVCSVHYADYLMS